MSELTYTRRARFGNGWLKLAYVIVVAALVIASAVSAARMIGASQKTAQGAAPRSMEERILRDAYAAVQQDPRNAEARWRLSLALTTIGDYPQARESAEQAVRLDKKLVEPYYALGLAYKGEGDLERAEKALAKAASLPGSHNEVYREVYFELGLVRGQLGNDKGAVKAFEAALANGPEATYVVVELAKAYRETGNLKRAKEEYLAVLGYDPTNQEAEKALKEMKVSAKDIADAKNPIAHRTPDAK